MERNDAFGDFLQPGEMGCGVALIEFPVGDDGETFPEGAGERLIWIDGLSHCENQTLAFAAMSKREKRDG